MTGGAPHSAKQAARAIDALRRGWPVRVHGEQAAITVVAAETGGADKAGAMLLSAARAATLKLTNQRAAGDTSLPVMIAMPPQYDAGLAMAIADPALDLRYPMKGPFGALPLPDDAAALAAMELARHAGLLPAFLVSDGDSDTRDGDDIDNVTPAQIAAYADSHNIQIAARARLPVSASQEAEIIAFRSIADATDHIALIIGTHDGSVPIVRLHSECLTGDVLGSLKCDCGPQLHEALEQMAATNWGILLYLRQEGRGIGLINKLRAYALQDQGFDTVDANIRLGFAVDARDFSIAAQMLRLLNVSTVKLLTNNPEKVAGLEAQGLSVAERLPLQIAANPHNRHYLDTKRERTGHKLR
ncbi:GTP cyclohydrolase II [Sphingorhabdus arenilitoris]|uniref:GTP cyclohydrolase-2 n=1 Tax=Sphingorhabdus arenilitoris TaxID=1490041 RepID=A0ABV8RJ31_9SPHN